MANHPSATKQHRQSLKRRLQNRGNRGKMRAAVKRFRQLIVGGELDAARTALPATLGLIDHSAKLGALPDNRAARTKSRLARALNKATAAAN